MDEAAAACFHSGRTSGVTARLDVSYENHYISGKYQSGKADFPENNRATITCRLMDGEQQVALRQQNTSLPGKIARAKFKYPGKELPD